MDPSLFDGRKPINSKWMFKNKFDAKRRVQKYKSYLLEEKHSHVEGIVFSGIFSHVAKSISIRLLFSLSMPFYLEVKQMDVKETFLLGDLEEELYMK